MARARVFYKEVKFHLFNYSYTALDETLVLCKLKMMIELK